jgi:hypothetical protein
VPPYGMSPTPTTAAPSASVLDNKVPVVFMELET